jgi:hypothetical protein
MAPAGDGAIAYRTVDPDTLASQDLSGFDVVVLANAPPPPPHVARRLVELVQNGGGLLVAAGDNVQPRPYVARIGEILPARPRADAPLDPPLTLSGAEGARIVSGIDTGLDAVRARRRLLLEPPGPDGHVELAFEDGAPALAVGTYGAGRTAILAVTLDDDFSDLPYRPGFLPLVVRLLRDLSSRGEVPDRAIAPGESVTISPPPGATRVVVIDPAGERHERDATGPIEITETDLAGAWRVQVSTSSAPLADDVRSAFVVAPPAEESDLASAELPTFDADEEGATESGAVVRRSAAPWLFLLAGLLVLLEALLRHNRPVFRSALARKMLRR